MTALLDALSRAVDACVPFGLCIALAAIVALCVIPGKERRR